MNEFDQVIERRNTNSAKWDMKKESILPMWVADMDFMSPKSVIKAIKDRAEHGIFGYTFLSEEYLVSIKNWIAKRHGWNIKKDWILYSPGIVPAINMLVKGLTKPGDKIIVQTPVYYPFFDAIKNNNRIILENPLFLENGKYRIDFIDLEKKTSDKKVKILILCSPHNPVGRVWTKKELKKIGEICLKNNVLIISDEIHSDLIYSGFKHTPFASISEEFEKNSITCIAPSKTFNLAGLQTSGIIVRDENIRDKFKKVMISNGLMSPNIFGQVALEAAYNNGEDWLQELIEYLESNLEFLNSFIKSRIPEISVIQPEGTYLVWLDCRKLNMEAKKMEEFMLNEAKVWFDEGYIFGKQGEGFERIVIACPKEILREGLERLESSIKK